MADPKELQNNLTQYRAQLSQVEAALTTDPENDELTKLKQDLLEVINLTLDLLNVNERGPSDSDSSLSKWKVGNKCQAIWSQTGNHYPATIDLISDDFTTCTVTFDYGNTEIVQLSTIKDASSTTPATGQKRSLDDQESTGSNKKISRKEKDQLREQKRKKMARKQQRVKELEEQREGEKNRWLDFFHNSKGASSSSKSSKVPKSLKGVSKKSIFASPETLNGKVGVGTCGIGDMPMTSFSKQDKVVYKK